MGAGQAMTSSPIPTRLMSQPPIYSTSTKVILALVVVGPFALAYGLFGGDGSWICAIAALVGVVVFSVLDSQPGGTY